MGTGFDTHLATLTGSNLPPRVANVLRQLLDLAYAELQPRIDPMLDMLDSEFFRDAEKSRNPGEQFDLLRAAQILREKRTAFAPAFFLHLEQHLARIRSPRAPELPASQWQEPLSNWTLEEGESVDADLQLRELAIPLESASSLPLYLLGQRFGVLAASPAFSNAQLPLGPQQLLKAAASGCQSAFGAQIPTARFLPLFSHHVLLHYPRFLKKIGLLMEQAGILPGLAFVPARPTKGARAAVEAVQSPATASSPTAPSSASTASPTVFSPAGLAPTSPHDTTHSPLSWLEQPQAISAECTSGQDAAPTFRQLQALLSAHRFASGIPLSKPVQAVSAISSAQADEILEQLAEQASLPSIREWHEALQKQIQLRHGEAVTLSRTDNDAIELLALLIEQIYLETHDGSSLPARLQRLQRPLLHAVIGGHAFFEDPNHPARQLLNTLVEYDAQVHAEHSADPGFDAAIEQAIEQLERHPRPDRQAFDEANQRLLEQLQQQLKRAQTNEKRCVEAMQGRERMLSAKNIAHDVLDSRLKNLALPPPLQTLLRNAWQDALTLALLRYGMPSQGWNTHLAHTEEILALLRNPAPAASAALKREVESALQRVGYHDEDAAAVADHLSRSPVASAENNAPNVEEIAARIQAHARFGADDAHAPDEPARSPATRSAREEAHYQQLCALPFGTWFDFVLNDQGETSRRRLSWYSKHSGEALLVNPRGQRVAIMHLDSLAIMMAQGKVRLSPPNQMRLVDRILGAIASMLQRLLRSDIHNAHPAASA